MSGIPTVAPDLPSQALGSFPKTLNSPKKTGQLRTAQLPLFVNLLLDPAALQVYIHIHPAAIPPPDFMMRFVFCFLFITVLASPSRTGRYVELRKRRAAPAHAGRLQCRRLPRQAAWSERLSTFAPRVRSRLRFCRHYRRSTRPADLSQRAGAKPAVAQGDGTSSAWGRQTARRPATASTKSCSSGSARNAPATRRHPDAGAASASSRPSNC